ncbi:hypothetical protein SAMN02745170_02483 [Propionispora hippei DSM 15287]|uniref:Uncharacterized protein n=1 Tax=Propionispora hippei DSM 15287 TaxID=1123003 RepID=A0A1M6J303_9FIRM|nr:hypothetical protein SAMN02745170_02483 [Propionispora hippei DSM 15287]
MTQSQENCLSDNHRLTCERREGDYDGKSICIGCFWGVRKRLKERASFVINFNGCEVDHKGNLLFCISTNMFLSYV